MWIILDDGQCRRISQRSTSSSSGIKDELVITPDGLVNNITSFPDDLIFQVLNPENSTHTIESTNLKLEHGRPEHEEGFTGCLMLWFRPHLSNGWKDPAAVIWDNKWHRFRRNPFHGNAEKHQQQYGTKMHGDVQTRLLVDGK